MSGRHGGGTHSSRPSRREPAGNRKASAHSGPRRRPTRRYAAGVVAAALLVGGGTFAVPRMLGGCGDEPATVAADPTIAPVVEQLVADHGGDLCGKVTVESVPSSEAATAVAKGTDAPTLWIPDSSYWISRVSASNGQLIDLASRSVASTPVILASRNTSLAKVPSWLSALEDLDLRLGNPTSSAIAGAPVLASLTEAEDEAGGQQSVTSAILPVAQKMSKRSEAQTSADRMTEVTMAGGVSVVTEQDYVSYGSRRYLKIGVPATGTYVLDYPVAVTAPAGRDADAAGETGERLADLMRSDDAADALSEAGLRTPDRAPLDSGRGVGPVKVLSPRDQRDVDTTLQQFAALALPSRVLVVEDVSASMKQKAGDDTRMGLTVKASLAGNQLFPDSTAMGLWAFSTRLDGGSDHKALVPIRSMTDQVGLRTQRQVLLDETRRLPRLVGGGTGLYDTVLAAWRTVKKDYDPNAVNSVVLFTDGANDDGTSIGYDELIRTLRREQDPAKPVVIVTVGISKDADAKVLKRISDVTGGTTYVAERPEEIRTVFEDALEARTR